MTKTIIDLKQIYNQIDWPLLESKLLKYNYLEASKPGALAICTSAVEIENKLARTEYFIEILQEELFNQLRLDLNAFISDFDFEAGLKRISVSSALRLEEINQFVLAIEFSISYLSRIKLEKLKYRPVEKDLRNLAKEFRRFVDTEGAIDYNRHPQLKNLFSKQKEIETQVRKRLDQLLKDPEFIDNLQIQQHDLIHDHYIIPIRSDHYRSEHGKIIARSDSGKTLFVEPFQIAKDNNARIEIVLEIEKILNKLESEFTENLKGSYQDLCSHTNFVQAVDEYQARAQFATSERYHRPHLLESPGIVLNSAHHPLIENSIPNDIEIVDKKGLVISGPNTGGKTATLKLLALYLNLIKRGYFTPARECKFFPYERFFFLGNDLQNLEEGLSSFASEVTSYLDLCHSLAETNLILIDEIFNSTASEEASALAFSLLKYIISKKEATVVVSTHHQTLKQYLHKDENFISAHVGFNREENQPTYKIIYGDPGSSYALEIFAEISKGTPDFVSVLKNAESYLDTNIIHYERMLSDLSRKQNHLNELINQQNQINNELKNQKDANEALFNLKLDQKLIEAQEDIEKIKAEAESLLKKVRKGEVSNSNKLQNKFAEINSKLRPQEKKKDQGSKQYESPEQLEVGGTYFCTQIEQNVELLSLGRNKAKVKAGKIKMEVKPDTLKLSSHSAKKSKNHQDRVQVFASHTSTSQLEYDCRGMRLSEFQTLVDQVLSELYLQNVPFANIIHGHGDGVLKKWLRGYIKTHPDFKLGTNETGNDGESRIELI